jgi:hypothetical protein
MIRKGRPVKGGIKRGPKGGQYQITASGKKEYVGKASNSVSASTQPKSAKKSSSIKKELAQIATRSLVHGAISGGLAFGYLTMHNYLKREAARQHANGGRFARLHSPGHDYGIGVKVK